MNNLLIKYPTTNVKFKINALALVNLYLVNVVNRKEKLVAQI